MLPLWALPKCLGHWIVLIKMWVPNLVVVCPIQSSPSPCRELICSETAQASSLNICPCFPPSLPGTLAWGSWPCLPLPDPSVPGSPEHPQVLAPMWFSQWDRLWAPPPTPTAPSSHQLHTTVTVRAHLHPGCYTSHTAVATCLLTSMQTWSRRGFGCLLPALFSAPETFMAHGKFPGKDQRVKEQATPSPVDFQLPWVIRLRGPGIQSSHHEYPTQCPRCNFLVTCVSSRHSATACVAV